MRPPILGEIKGCYRLKREVAIENSPREEVSQLSSPPRAPVLIKFFANKIESSKEDWPDYLLEIANVFSEFDGEEFDRDILQERFADLSDRSPYALRDPGNFRDEFGAYMSYLGVFRIEERHGNWTIVLSRAARRFLCTPEPDVEAFCRAQLSLFQYPNGSGATRLRRQDGSLYYFTQRNVLDDTVREVAHGVRVVPFRLILSALLAKAEGTSSSLHNVELSFAEILALFNDPRTNTNPIPRKENILRVLEDVRLNRFPDWLHDNKLLVKFKRNFHIFGHTGLLIRTKTGLRLNLDLELKLRMIRSICEMRSFFDSFETCRSLHGNELKKCVLDVIESPDWSQYYDSANLPASLLAVISGEDVETLSEDQFVTQFREQPVTYGLTSDEPEFPEFTRYRADRSGDAKAITRAIMTNPELARVKREKANRDHARLVERVAALIRARGGQPLENTFVDLFADLGQKYIFEMKSCNQSNLLAQVRKGISQLYEYRYRAQVPNAILCLVLQEAPRNEPWLVDYLVRDRGITLMWLIDDVTLDCPSVCRSKLEVLLGP